MTRALLVFFLCCCIQVAAQTNMYRFDHVDLRKAIGETRMGIIGIDSSGKVWFNVDKGIGVYDGYLFRKYTSVKCDSNSLREGYVTTTMLDAHGKI
jgi:hypothetical protein